MLSGISILVVDLFRLWQTAREREMEIGDLPSVAVSSIAIGCIRGKLCFVSQWAISEITNVWLWLSNTSARLYNHNSAERIFSKSRSDGNWSEKHAAGVRRFKSHPSVTEKKKVNVAPLNEPTTMLPYPASCRAFFSTRCRRTTTTNEIDWQYQGWSPYNAYHRIEFQVKGTGYFEGLLLKKRKPIRGCSQWRI